MNSLKQENEMSRAILFDFTEKRSRFQWRGRFSANVSRGVEDLNILPHTGDNAETAQEKDGCLRRIESASCAAVDMLRQSRGTALVDGWMSSVRVGGCARGNAALEIRCRQRSSGARW
jgi:hypothetical protein